MALCLGLPGSAGTRKVKPNLDFAGARDSEWQWHQLGHMQICTSLHTDNHASTQQLSFLQAGCPSWRPTNSIKALKAVRTTTTASADIIINKNNWSLTIDIYIFLLVLEENVHLLLLQCLQTLLQITQECADLLWCLSHTHVQHKCRMRRKIQQLGFLCKTRTVTHGCKSWHSHNRNQFQEFFTAFECKFEDKPN